MQDPHSYRTIVVDPPWPGPGGSPTFDRHRGLCLIPYHTMSGVQVSALRIPQLAHPEAQLFLWATSRNLGDAYLLLQTWAFYFRGLFIWKKPGLGLGRHVRNETEFLVWGGRIGSPLVAPKECPRQIQRWPRPRRHSEKPAQAYTFIARLSLPPRLEIFARKPHPGFQPWGDELETPL